MPGSCAVLDFPTVTGTTRANPGVDKTSKEEALIRRVQARDEIAFRELVERYQDKVFSIIHGILRNHNDAEDIAQQVFTKTYFSISSFDLRSSLITWIYRITVNECYGYLRKKRARRVVYESDFSSEEALRAEAGECVDPAPPVERQLLERDLAAKLLAKVPKEARTLMMLREVEGHSLEELAGMTGLNENTIKVKLFRARQKLLKAARLLGSERGRKTRSIIAADSHRTNPRIAQCGHNAVSVSGLQRRSALVTATSSRN
jgi:RNA polymerase sigma-70 factor, ECF subfamily